MASGPMVIVNFKVEKSCRFGNNGRKNYGIWVKQYKNNVKPQHRRVSSKHTTVSLLGDG